MFWCLRGLSDLPSFVVSGNFGLTAIIVRTWSQINFLAQSNSLFRQVTLSIIHFGMCVTLFNLIGGSLRMIALSIRSPRYRYASLLIVPFNTFTFHHCSIHSRSVRSLPSALIYLINSLTSFHLAYSSKFGQIIVKAPVISTLSKCLFLEPTVGDQLGARECCCCWYTHCWRSVLLSSEESDWF